MGLVVAHAEHQDTRVGIGGFQAPEQFQTAETREIEVQDDQHGPLFAIEAERLLAVGRLPDFDVRFRRQQPPQAGPDDRVVIDDQDLHDTPACSLTGRGSWPVVARSSTVKAKPSPLWFASSTRPPIALTRSPIPTRP